MTNQSNQAVCTPKESAPIKVKKKPAPKPHSKYKVGQVVVDENKVPCVIIAVWGGFSACTKCYGDTAPIRKTKCCGKPSFNVGAQNTYDVHYQNGKQRAWDACSLKVPQA